MNITELKSLEVSRKMDNVGRIGIPKKIRDDYKMLDGDDFEFFILKTDNKKLFLCLELIPNRKTPEELEALIHNLQEYGIEVPQDLWAQFQELKAKRD